MADEVDIANDLMGIELRHALDKLRQSSSQNVEGSKICLECGDDMPEARRALGFKLCVSCAEESERRKSLFAE